MSEQLSFDLPVNVSLGAEDYFVAPANEQAFAMIANPGGWPDGKLILVGPQGSGKSHLAKVWQLQNDAEMLWAERLDPGRDLPVPGARVVLEDADHLPQTCEEYLFHLHNHLQATHGLLLITAKQPPSRWNIALPDLASRMQAATVIGINDPDDDLLCVVLLKLFADRQLTPAPGVLNFLLGRIERSFAAAAEVVSELDAMALARKSSITTPLARLVLDKIASKREDTRPSVS